MGYATAESITGPWERSEKPVPDMESNNPALLVEDEKVKPMFRDEKLKVFVVEADSFRGPYKTGSVLHSVRRECPQFLIVDGRITHLITGVYDGRNSWCQQVRLKRPAPVD